MAGAVPSGSFRIGPVDRLGRRIDPAVLAAAEEILPRAVAHGVKLLGDLAVIANLLEEAAAVVSRRLHSDPSLILNVPGYLLMCFVRKANRLKRKQLVTVSLSETVRPKVAWADPTDQLHAKILLDEFLARCDFITRDMVWRRKAGFSWEEIGRVHGISAHAAEERVRYVFQQVRGKLKI
jgi:DNA-directed RNA polymerase specialized sigma24 family protein